MKRMWVLLGVIVLIFLVCSAIPMNNGPTVSCDPGMEQVTMKLDDFGLPFGYLENTTHIGSQCILVKNGRDVFSVNDKDGVGYDNYHFKLIEFIADLAIVVCVVLLIYWPISAYMVGHGKNIC